MNLPFAPLAAAVLGAAAAAAVALMPTPLLEAAVMDSGIPAVLAAAEPPLGFTARAVIAAGAGGLVGLFVWFALFLLLGTRGVTLGRSAEPLAPEAVPTPVLRRADAHPDAPPRAPLLATRDLGMPFLEVTARAKADEVGKVNTYDALTLSEPLPPDPVFAPAPEPIAEPKPVIAPEPEFAREEPVIVPPPAPPPTYEAAPVDDWAPPPPRIILPDERPLPEDLDQPLSAFDPEAIPDAPVPPSEPVAPLQRGPRPAVFDPTERFETFELTPVRRTPPPRPVAVPDPAPRARDEAITAPETEATIHALLERLERGVVRRGLATGSEPARTPREAERGLEEALVTLRNLARRA